MKAKVNNNQGEKMEKQTDAIAILKLYELRRDLLE